MTGTPDGPVTVAITRRADPAHGTEMHAWVQAGMTMAQQFDGYLGGGWVRSGVGSGEWHMLYRFADASSLAAWEGSPQRQWWLHTAQGLVEHTRTERRTGIEGWFDPPEERSLVEHTASAPPRWKQATTIWVVFFPLNLLATVTLGRLLADVHVVPRVMVTTLVLTPVMTYLLLPWVTRRLDWWLHGRPRRRHG
ncbi:antibiotic biosynthesis monooxygenase [Umezawaea tangerina]|nr:antibiotic biosynthesis monooxygenase [Umezawaea tangerina]